MLDAYAYLNLTRARDKLQSCHAHQTIENDSLLRTGYTRAPDSARIVNYDRMTDHCYRARCSRIFSARVARELCLCTLLSQNLIAGSSTSSRRSVLPLRWPVALAAAGGSLKASPGLLPGSPRARAWAGGPCHKLVYFFGCVFPFSLFLQKIGLQVSACAKRGQSLSEVGA